MRNFNKIKLKTCHYNGRKYLEIGDIVWGVTKISKISDIDAEDAKAETLKRTAATIEGEVSPVIIAADAASPQPVRPLSSVILTIRLSDVAMVPVDMRIGVTIGTAITIGSICTMRNICLLSFSRRAWPLRQAPRAVGRRKLRPH